MKNLATKKTTFKLSLMSAALITMMVGSQAFAVDVYLSSNANTFVQGNNDSSAGNEGVFITSNSGSANPNAAMSLTTNGSISIQSGGQNTGTQVYDPNTYINSLGATGTGIGSGTTFIGTAGANTNIGAVGSTNTVLGTTSINATGGANTTIGTAGASTNAVSGFSNSISATGTGSNNSISALGANATNTISASGAGSSNIITGSTYINDSQASATNINTGTSTGAVTIGNRLDTTNLSGGTNNMGVSSAYNTANNIGTNSAYASTNTIGNTNSSTTINSYASNTQQVLKTGSATTQATSSGATALSVGGTGSVISATNSGVAGFVLQSNSGGGQKITVGTTTQDTAGVVVVNAAGNANGVVANQNSATLSGGNGSGATSLTMSNNVATFSNAASGAPIKVTGVADGTGAFDAVNYRQLQSVASGVAGTAAMANIPVATGANGKDFAVGVGLGNYMGQTSVALGGSYRIMEGAYVKASVASSNTNNGYSMGSSQNTVYGVGAGISF